MASYNGVAVPTDGARITYHNKAFIVPENPIIPYIEGDGTGRDIWRAAQRVFDAAVEKSYGDRRRVVWYEVFAGEKAFRQFKTWLPDDSVDAIRAFRIAISKARYRRSLIQYLRRRASSSSGCSQRAEAPGWIGA